MGKLACRVAWLVDCKQHGGEHTHTHTQRPMKLCTHQCTVGRVVAGVAITRAVALFKHLCLPVAIARRTKLGVPPWACVGEQLRLPKLARLGVVHAERRVAERLEALAVRSPSPLHAHTDNHVTAQMVALHCNQPTSRVRQRTSPLHTPCPLHTLPLSPNGHVLATISQCSPRCPGWQLQP